MTLEENKAIVRRHLVDVLEKGNVELIDGYYAPDASVTFPNYSTPAKWRETVITTHQHSRNLKVTILDMVAEGDKVAASVQIDITYVKPVEARLAVIDGKPVTWRNMDFYRLEGGKIVGWSQTGSFTDMMVKIGAYKLAPVEPA